MCIAIFEKVNIIIIIAFSIYSLGVSRILVMPMTVSHALVDKFPSRTMEGY